MSSIPAEDYHVDLLLEERYADFLFLQLPFFILNSDPTKANGGIL
jgi:hypothetical protein